MGTKKVNVIVKPGKKIVADKVAEVEAKKEGAAKPAKEKSPKREVAPVGTVNAHGRVKQEDGTWKYVKKEKTEKEAKPKAAKKEKAEKVSKADEASQEGNKKIAERLDKENKEAAEA